MMFKFLKNSTGRFNPFVTIVIVGAWLVLVGLLVRDRYSSSAMDAGTNGFHIAAAESDDWFIIRIGGAYAGYGRSRQMRKGNDWIIRDDLNISLNIQGQVKPIRIANESTVDQNFRLISFNLRIASGVMSFEQKGTVKDRELIVDVPKSQGGGTRKLRLYESPRISRSLGLPVPLTGLKVGDEIHLPVFDPLDGAKWDAVIRVLEKADIDINGKKIESWRVKAAYRSVELIMWIDEKGGLLKGRMPLDMTVTRSDKSEIAREMKSSTRDLPEMMELSAVPVEGVIPENTDLKMVRFRVQSDKELPILSDGFRQTVAKDEIIIVKEQMPEATYSLPNTDRAMEQYLTHSRFIRSDNAEIIAKAREIVGDEKDPIKAALLINEWVFKYLKKVPTPGVPDAYSTLLVKQGDCKEHAVLAVSLARAIGLPARMAVGLVNTEDGFAFHAWVNYWAGKTWFSADPLMNRVPVTPLYITLVYGDVDKHVNVVAYLGSMKLKVLEAK
jgi:hypothetical protein